MKNMQALKTEGFTLFETMIALSIIAIVLISVFKMHIQTISMNNAVKFYTNAPLLAQNKIEELKTISSYDQTSDSGNFGDRFPGYTWSVFIDDVESEVLEDIAGRLKKIDVSVYFNADEFSYGLRAYRLIEEEE